MKNLFQSASVKIGALASALFCLNATAQEVDTINVNQMYGMVANEGVLFQDVSTIENGYRLGGEFGPSGIFSMGFWMGGIDASGDLHSANQMYFGNEDFYPGPIADDYASSDYVDDYGQGIWSIYESEIQDHIDNWSTGGYVVPATIASWPANGNAAIGVSNELAPYYDMNGNSIYDPENGDYPIIRGDHAIYSIMNDENGVHVNGAEIMSAEIHTMIYQYNGDPVLNQSTFMNIKIYNRRSIDLYDFGFSIFTDFDFGDVFNDYLGCDSTRNVTFTYNSNVEDPQWGGISGALGLVSLDDNFGSSRMMSNAPGGPFGNPSTPEEFYNSTLGLTIDGDQWYNDGMNGMTSSGYTTSYLHSGNPSLLEWSEVTAGNPADDRRAITGTHPDTLLAGNSLCFDYALVYDVNYDSTNIQNVSTMLAAVDDVQAWYNVQDFDCGGYKGTAGMAEEAAGFSVYPNPSTGKFTIVQDGKYDLRIMNMNGQFVFEEKGLINESQFDLNLGAGLYIIQIQQGSELSFQRLIIQ